MILTDNGLRLSKSELRALLAFSSTDSSSKFFGVHFKSTQPRDSQDQIVKARATDGAVAVDAFGHSSLDRDAEWFVSRAFLVGLSKLADSTHHVLLKFSGASLHEAAVEDVAGSEVATFSWPGTGAASSQISFADAEEWDKRLKLPSRSRGVKCLELKVASLALLSRLGAAAGNPAVECYPPPHDDDRLLVRAEGEDTTWVAVIDPAPATDAIGED
jgi:hypothetical protein